MPSITKLAALAIILAVASYGLSVSRPVVLPLVLAFGCASMLHPALLRLERLLPRSVAVLLVAMVPLVFAALGMGAMVFMLSTQADTLSAAIDPMVASTKEQLTSLRQMGLPVPKPGDASVSDALADAATSLGLGGTQTVSVLLIAQFFLLLGLLELPAWRDKLEEHVPAARLAAGVEVAAARIRAYFLTRSIACLVSGGVVWIALTALGIPGAPVFGVLTALMNYLPTVGAFIAAAPIIAVAAGTAGPGTAALVAGILFVNEQLVGNLLDPMLQGERVGLAPTLVLLSLLLWGLLWGIPGAFVAVPITLCILSAMEQVPALHDYAHLFLTAEADPEPLARRSRRKK